jgi:guanylate kinase
MEKQNNKIVVIEGPSGAGKDSIINGLIELYPHKYEKIISMTTREMREFEKPGNPYHFVTDIEFDKMLKSGDIFEHTIRHGTKRGMSERYITDILKKNKTALKDCDIVGVRALRKRFNNVITVFITADKKDIEKRMRSRGDREEDIKIRLADYDKYMKNIKYYDYIVKNEDLKKAIENVENIIYNA